MLEWQWPWIGLLLPLPWVVHKLLPPADSTPAAIRVPFFEDLAQSSGGVSSYPKISAILSVLMWLLLLISAARPVWYGEPVDIATSGRDLMLAIDISDSMRIDDMQIDGRQRMRIDVVKTLAGEFIRSREKDRVGLILFGQQAYLQTPFTFDRDSVVEQLTQAQAGFAGSSTAIGDALGLAIKQLRDRPAKSRVLILLSDGSNTYGSDPLDAITVAAEAGIKIHAIGMGADIHTGRDVIGRKIEVNPSRDLDEPTLAAIADATGGVYFRAKNPDELSEIYATIDQLEPAPARELIRPERSLYHWPLFLSLLCALLVLELKRRNSYA